MTISGVMANRREVVAKQARHLPGEAGTWVLIFGDMVTFAAFFGTFLVVRGSQPGLFEASRSELTITIGLVNTVVLLTGSVVVVVALFLLRAGRRALASRLFFVGAASGIVFMSFKAIEYTALARAGHTPAANDFFQYYFILTGLHLFHVVLGVGALVVLGLLARRPGTSERRMAFIEGGACFWHLVDLLWIMLFALLYLAS